MNFSKRILVREDRFEGKFILISLHKKFIYLSSKIKNIEVSISIDTRAINLFVSQIYIKKLESA